MTLLPLLFCCTANADTAAPTWPDDAWLIMDQRQVLYDHPATTEGELRRRDQEVGIDLRWPAARDDAGVVEYRVFQGTREQARLPGDTRTWSAEVQDQPALWAVVPVDAAGNRGPRLEAELRCVPLPGDGAGSRLVGVAEPGTTISDLLASGGGLFGDGVPSGLGSFGSTDRFAGTPATAADISIRIGRKGSEEAFFDERLRYGGEDARTWTTRDGDRPLSVRLSPHAREGTDWVVEVHLLPPGGDARLSRLILTDPLDTASLGSCATDTDDRTTGGLWVEVGVDPRGGEPRRICERAARER